MNNTKKKYNRTTTRHARRNRAQLLGILLICATGSTGNGQMISPDSPHGLPSVQNFTANQNTYDVVFNALLNALIEIFRLIDETQTPLSADPPLSETLVETADEVLSGYVTKGLSPNLTASETSDGILNCEEAISMLKDTSIELSLPQSTQNALADTLRLISGELNASF